MRDIAWREYNKNPDRYIRIVTGICGDGKTPTKEQIKHIANSIKEFGFNDPLGIAGEDNIVLEGNGRVEAAKTLGITKIPCVRLDHLSKEERQAYVIAHNSTNLETGFDLNILQKEIDSLPMCLNFLLVKKKMDKSHYGN